MKFMLFPEAQMSDKVLSLKEAGAAAEAMLFVSGSAVSTDALASVLGYDTKTTEELLRQLSEQYRAEKRGIRIIRLEDAWQMCTDPAQYDFVSALLLQPKKKNLTGVQLEVLSIIAYRQPVTRAEIDQIRGVNCDHAVNKLLEYGLIEEAGRMDAPGRPILFKTTEEFLRHFGLSSKDSLPVVSPEKMDEFKTEADEEASEDITV